MPGHRFFAPCLFGALALGFSITADAQTFQGQPVNIDQVHGSTVATGNGTSSSSTQRVTVSSDSTGLITTPAIGLNGSTAKTSSILIGVSDGTNQQQVLAPLILGDGVNGNNTVSTGNFLFNGSGWDRGRTVTGDLGTGTGVAAVASAPHSGAAGVLPTGTASSALASSSVLCAAACNAYGFQVNTTTAAEWVMAFNATSAPADGAVTPARWWQVPANGTLTVDMTEGGVPIRYGTGWTLVCSSTGPFTKTASALCTFVGEAK